ncbi:hypothetical protein [Gemmatimonas sp.]|jgi:hypothetical protein|uniref:hypothetical protein n=1 Tax=Gemmatimonas sp. TaxID=1962908 RepID=UPI0022CAD460|nr:hypothetical protein [Gemmatimonas sp.]MCZ8205719.1 hypothetical protein [Gemmatimonas sp.]
MTSLDRAFDELRFGGQRTLNLRALQPTALQATALAEQWLREQQVLGADEALVITGRGNNSVDGYSPVREAIVRLLPSLRRRNVIAGYAEHTPGSFVVTFAPVTALFETPKRRREKPAPPPRPSSLHGLDDETVRQLRDVAVLSLAVLGVNSPTRAQLEDEMLRQFAALTAALPEGADREALLQQALLRAAEEYEAG